MFQLSQSKTSRRESSAASTASNSNNNQFKQIGRRLSTNLHRVIQRWRNSDAGDFLNSSSHDLYPKELKNNLQEILSNTKFSKDEIKFIYRDFKQKCPAGYLTETFLVEIYSQFFPLGDCASYGKHLFSALSYHSNNRDYFCSSNTVASQETKVSFQDFINSLSILTKGSLDEKIKWIFQLYDLNKDGVINADEVSSMLNSIYDLMGQYVDPPIDETSRHLHLEYAIEKLGMNNKPFLSYNEFKEIFVKQPELIEILMNWI